MSKTILVPTDFSQGAENALNYAVVLAKKENAGITLLHSFHPVYVSSDIPTKKIADEMMNEQKSIKQILAAMCKNITQVKKVQCDSICKQGFAVDVILDTIKEKKPQLVVMGTKGASGLKEIIIGSNTAKVIEKAQCPVIAVPQNSVCNGIKKITYATDYLTSDITDLKKIIEIAQPFKAEITLLHASDAEYTPDADELLMRNFKNMISKKIDYNKLIFKISHGKYLEKVLQEHIKSEKPDLIAMSTLHRDLFDRLFGTSATKKMAYHSQIPLLAFHHKHESVIFI